MMVVWIMGGRFVTFTVFFYFTLSTTTAKFEFFSDFLLQKICVYETKPNNNGISPSSFSLYLQCWYTVETAGRLHQTVTMALVTYPEKLIKCLTRPWRRIITNGKILVPMASQNRTQTVKKDKSFSVNLPLVNGRMTSFHLWEVPRSGDIRGPQIKERKAVTLEIIWQSLCQVIGRDVSPSVKALRLGVPLVKVRWKTITIRENVRDRVT